jgi:hypothetical protein
MARAAGSWVVSRIATGEAIFETFDPATAERINRKLYQVETALEYLVRINRKIAERRLDVTRSRL